MASAWQHSKCEPWWLDPLWPFESWTCRLCFSNLLDWSGYKQNIHDLCLSFHVILFSCVLKPVCKVRFIPLVVIQNRFLVGTIIFSRHIFFSLSGFAFHVMKVFLFSPHHQLALLSLSLSLSLTHTHSLLLWTFFEENWRKTVLLCLSIIFPRGLDGI